MLQNLPFEVASYLESNTRKNIRAELLQNMEKLSSTSVSCRGCQGYCCTSMYNSMQITQTESLELTFFLWENKRIDSDLINLLNENVKNFRLDIELPRHGAREPMRRTYTCPFFAGKELGCSIDKNFKPFGCLAFNPISQGIQGSDCTSDNNLLENLTEVFEVKIFDWKKKPIPVAVLAWIAHLGLIKK